MWCTYEDGLYVWEWFGCVMMVCMCEAGLYHTYKWFGCVMMVCMCPNGLDV